MDEVWERVMRLFRDYLKRLEMHRLWNDAADLVLTFARDGIAYAYLIALALREGMPASQFLLYFTAVSGFTQWVGSILEKGAELAPAVAGDLPPARGAGLAGAVPPRERQARAPHARHGVRDPL